MSRPLHCECFSSACLTVGKDANIVTIHTRLHEWLDLLKNVSLSAFRPKDAIYEVREDFFLAEN